ncbi:autotransporter outer membrane beta-barrel domain-containing protein [Lelliottia aquatilis]|uniref:autotransporter outer membrane beta-barrel domain-containing protein n=1 Tax=Lelliottia aquatilis TaxID=2080838 RepID=UPI00192C2F8C|nr:autotransporter outer membrane beta-barrel domain-containing protein [Lelliottia aquatilis]MBL5882416.1 autotransporter outer membrane beta-barrel domain-containing protein [Lelliottia aquatilis]
MNHSFRKTLLALSIISSSSFVSADDGRYDVYDDYVTEDGITLPENSAAEVRGNSTIKNNNGPAIDMGNGTRIEIVGDGDVAVQIKDSTYGILSTGDGNVVHVTNASVSNHSVAGITMKGNNSELYTTMLSGSSSEDVISGADGIQFLDGNNVRATISDNTHVFGLTGNGIYSDAGDLNLKVNGHSTVTGEMNGIQSVGDQATIRLDDAVVAGNQNDGVTLSGNNSQLLGTRVNIHGKNNGVSLTGDNSILYLRNSGLYGEQALAVSRGSQVFIEKSTVKGTRNLIYVEDAGAQETDINIAHSTVGGDIFLNSSSSGSKATTITFSDETTWSGSADLSGTDLVQGAALELNTGAEWTNTGDSRLASLSLNNGTVNMTGGNITTGVLKGNPEGSDEGPSYVLSNYNNDTGKAFILTADKSAGTLTAGVASNSSGAAGLMYGNVIVHVTDAAGTNFNTMVSDVGVYRYQSYVIKNDDGSTDVILGTLGDITDPTIPQTPDITNPAAPQTPDITNPAAPQTPDITNPAAPQNPDITNPAAPQNPGSRPPELSTGAQTVVNTRAAAVTLWRDEEEALNLRMDNNRRTGEKNAHGVWGSYYGSDTRQQMDGASSGFEQENHGFMLGYDKEFELNNGNVLLGMSVMRGSSDVSMTDKANTGSNITGYSGTLYGSFRHHNGIFVDGSVKASRMENDLNVTSLDGGRSSASYDSAGFGGRLKTGVRLQPLKTLFVEPYVSLSYARFNGVDYKLSNGLHARDSGYESLRSEAGANVGTQWTLKNGGRIAPYIHAAVADEMAKNNKMNMNGIEVKDSTDGMAGIVGLGADVAFKSGFGGYVGANYSKGENHEKPWQVNAGITYSW